MTDDEVIEFRGFKNGWEAHIRVSYSYSPECFFNSDNDKTQLQMFAQQKNTCSEGHHTFRCHPLDVKSCLGCQKLFKRGEWNP